LQRFFYLFKLLLRIFFIRFHGKRLVVIKTGNTVIFELQSLVALFNEIPVLLGCLVVRILIDQFLDVLEFYPRVVFIFFNRQGLVVIEPGDGQIFIEIGFIGFGNNVLVFLFFFFRKKRIRQGQNFIDSVFGVLLPRFDAQCLIVKEFRYLVVLAGKGIVCLGNCVVVF